MTEFEAIVATSFSAEDLADIQREKDLHFLRRNVDAFLDKLSRHFPMELAAQVFEEATEDLWAAVEAVEDE